MLCSSCKPVPLGAVAQLHWAETVGILLFYEP